MHSVFIYEVNALPFFKNAFFFKKCCRELTKALKHMDISFTGYGLPVETLIHNTKKMQKYIDFLKKEGVSHILLSDGLMQQEEICRSLSENFALIQGTKVINYKLFDILRKCADAKEIEIANSTLVLGTDSPSQAEEIILRLYKHVKKIRIQTERTEAFKTLVEFFMNEYGLYVETGKEKIKENELYVMLDENIKEKSEINISKKSFTYTKVYFKTKHILDSYFEKIHQAALEFLVLKKFGTINEAIFTSFIKEYNVRIAKIENNN